MTAEDMAYQKIIHLILEGHYKPGDFLLETELAQNLGMSRTPIGRATGRLVAEGFLSRMPKKGCFIPYPTPQDAEQVFMARMSVEGQAAAYAAKKATDEEIHELELILKPEIEALNRLDKDVTAQINRQFHSGIAKASHNAYLEAWVTKIFWRSNLYIFYFDSFYHMNRHDEIPVQKTPVQHKTILDTIMERSPELAEQRMREHIQTTFEKLMFGL